MLRNTYQIDCRAFAVECFVPELNFEALDFGPASQSLPEHAANTVNFRLVDQTALRATGIRVADFGAPKITFTNDPVRVEKKTGPQGGRWLRV